jgi:hypothetical protein
MVGDFSPQKIELTAEDGNPLPAGGRSEREKDHEAQDQEQPILVHLREDECPGEVEDEQLEDERIAEKTGNHTLNRGQTH